MSPRKSSICALSVFILAGIAAGPTGAAAADGSALTPARLQQLFHTPPFDPICPLDVYNEDYTRVGTVAPRGADARRADVAAPENRVQVAGGPGGGAETAVSDGLDVYNEDFTRAR